MFDSILSDISESGTAELGHWMSEELHSEGQNLIQELCFRISTIMMKQHQIPQIIKSKDQLRVLIRPCNLPFVR